MPIIPDGDARPQVFFNDKMIAGLLDLVRWQMAVFKWSGIKPSQNNISSHLEHGAMRESDVIELPAKMASKGR